MYKKNKSATWTGEEKEGCCSSARPSNAFLDRSPFVCSFDWKVFFLVPHIKKEGKSSACLPILLTFSSSFTDRRVSGQNRCRCLTREGLRREKKDWRTGYLRRHASAAAGKTLLFATPRSPASAWFWLLANRIPVSSPFSNRLASVTGDMMLANVNTRKRVRNVLWFMMRDRRIQHRMFWMEGKFFLLSKHQEKTVVHRVWEFEYQTWFTLFYPFLYTWHKTFDSENLSSTLRWLPNQLTIQMTWASFLVFCFTLKSVSSASIYFHPLSSLFTWWYAQIADLSDRFSCFSV